METPWDKDGSTNKNKHWFAQDTLCNIPAQNQEKGIDINKIDGALGIFVGNLRLIVIGIRSEWN